MLSKFFYGSVDLDFFLEASFFLVLRLVAARSYGALLVEDGFRL